MSASLDLALAERLDRTWRTPHRGLRRFFSDVSHVTLGTRFIVTAFVFFVLGGLEALAMRIQLARPENELIGPDLCNQLFTMDGSTMMFLFAVPVMEGIGLLLVPWMVGTRNAAFPRLNAFERTTRTSSAASCSTSASPSTRVRTPAGSATCRFRARATRPASASTSGRR